MILISIISVGASILIGINYILSGYDAHGVPLEYNEYD